VAPPSAEQVQAEYRAMLTQDLGKAVFNRAPSRDDGRPVGLIRLMFRPAGLFGIALMAMFIVLGVKLWREGVFDSFRVRHAEVVPIIDKSWMLGDRRRPSGHAKTAGIEHRDTERPEATVPASDEAAPGDDAPE
jgi:hypothetical protein